MKYDVLRNVKLPLIFNSFQRSTGFLRQKPLCHEIRPSRNIMIFVKARLHIDAFMKKLFVSTGLTNIKLYY